MDTEFAQSREGFTVTTDPGWLESDFIFRSLRSTYWAADWPRELIDEAFSRSLVFGLYAEEPRRQLGFARVVTDRTTFSWLCDVFVAEECRGRGLGSWLISVVLAHPWVRHTRVTLGTRTAHAFYEKFGFVRYERMVRPAEPRA